MARSTQNTVVGVFPDEATAASIAGQISGLGIPRDNIHLGNQSKADPTDEPPPGGIVGWLEDFFSSPAEDQDRGRYAEAAGLGNYVLAVDTDETNEDRVMEIMQGGSIGKADQHYIDYVQREQPAVDKDMSYDTSISFADASEHDDEKLGLEVPVSRLIGQRGGVRVYSRINESGKK